MNAVDALDFLSVARSSYNFSVFIGQVFSDGVNFNETFSVAVNIKISVNPLNGALSGASRKPAVNVGGTYGVVVLTTRSNRIAAAMGRREKILNYNLSSRDLNRVKL
jgi:hypothetical protein